MKPDISSKSLSTVMEFTLVNWTGLYRASQDTTAIKTQNKFALKVSIYFTSLIFERIWNRYFHRSAHFILGINLLGCFFWIAQNYLEKSVVANQSWITAGSFWTWWKTFPLDFKVRRRESSEALREIFLPRRWLEICRMLNNCIGKSYSVETGFLANQVWIKNGIWKNLAQEQAFSPPV